MLFEIFFFFNLSRNMNFLDFEMKDEKGITIPFSISAKKKVFFLICEFIVSKIELCLIMVFLS